MLLVDIYILFFDGSYEQGYWFFAFMIIIDFFIMVDILLIVRLFVGFLAFT